MTRWRPTIHRGTLFSLLAAVILGGGCSSFNRDWKEAGKSVSTAGLEGRWQGTWRSDVNGHTGKLRCLVTKTNDQLYEARFRANYLRILRFSYTVPLQVETVRTQQFKFQGDADLGKLAGGLYTYDGQANETNFFSTYTSKYDRGTFQMRSERSGFED